MKLEVEAVEFSYDAEPVLEDVRMAVDNGEFLGIIGPNGSGKSTLLKCLNRILKPERETILLDGEPMDSMSRDDVAKTMGYVPQHDDDSFPATVFNTVLMGRKPYISWKPRSEDVEITRDTLERLDLGEFAMRDVQQLSGGQRQKVTIGRALAQEPDVLVLDEPTSDLDLRHQLEVLDVIREQVDDGISAIMAIHDLNMAARYSDKLLMIEDGRVYEFGGTDILTEENIETVYGVRADVKVNGDERYVVPREPLTKR
ncbi:MAG: ABC transporter ATP-binding protein [Halodesulfurarchaeum sp.]